MGSFFLKRGDTQPVLQTQLLEPDGDPHDLSVGSPSVKLHIILADDTVLERDMTIITPADGIVQYAWAASDWDAGNLYVGYGHKMEYEVIRSSARITFPNTYDYDNLCIAPDIADGSS